MDIEDRLADKVPTLRWIDQYHGQDMTDLRPSLAYPAALIEFEQSDYEGMGQYDQFCRASLTVRLLLDNYASSAQKSPAKSRNAAMRCYELEDEVVNALHGWTPDEDFVQPLIRTADRSENRNDIGLRIRIISFSTAWECADIEPEPEPEEPAEEPIEEPEPTEEPTEPSGNEIEES